MHALLCDFCAYLRRIWKEKVMLFLNSFTVNFNSLSIAKGARGSLVVMALRYKPAGRGFDSRWCHWNFSVT